MKHLKLYEDIEWDFEEEEFEHGDKIVWTINFFIADGDSLEYGEFFLAKMTIINNNVEGIIYKDLSGYYKDIVVYEFRMNNNDAEKLINGEKKTFLYDASDTDIYYYIKTGNEPPTSKQIQEIENEVANFIINYFNIEEYLRDSTDSVYDLVYNQFKLKYIKH